MHADLKARLEREYPASYLEPLPPSAAGALRAGYAGIPEEYIKFLLEVGYGRIGHGNFAVYSGPLQPGDLYDEQTAQELSGVVLVGDDFSGYCIGYDTKAEWAFGEVGPDGSFSADSEGIGGLTEYVSNRFLSTDHS